MKSCEIVPRGLLVRSVKLNGLKASGQIPSIDTDPVPYLHMACSSLHELSVDSHAPSSS